jgi:hypothetical protein
MGMAAAAATALSASSAASSSQAVSGSATHGGSSVTAGTGTAEGPKAVMDTGLVKGMTLPLQQYMQTYQDSVVIERAARSLETECMARFGFTVTFPPAGGDPPPNADDANMPRRYGISDPAAAAKYGYELPPDLTDHPKPPELTPAAIAVLTGRKGRIRGPSRHRPLIRARRFPRAAVSRRRSTNSVPASTSACRPILTTTAW